MISYRGAEKKGVPFGTLFLRFFHTLYTTAKNLTRNSAEIT